MRIWFCFSQVSCIPCKRIARHESLVHHCPNPFDGSPAIVVAYLKSCLPHNAKLQAASGQLPCKQSIGLQSKHIPNCTEHTDHIHRKPFFDTTDLQHNSLTRARAHTLKSTPHFSPTTHGAYCGQAEPRGESKHRMFTFTCCSRERHF